MSIPKLLEAARSQVNNAIYVWGGDGENLSEMKNPKDWIERKEETKSNRNRVLALYQSRMEDGVNPIRAFDCSGLVYWCLKQAGTSKGDMTANSFYKKSRVVALQDLRLGDFVVQIRNGKAVHIGIVSGFENGKIYVIESKGRDYGVVETYFTPLKLYGWNGYCRWKAYDTAAPKNDPEPEEKETVPTKYEFVFDRVLKYGSKGEDVKELKKLLNKQGVGVLTVTNGNYLGTTRKIVKLAQKKLGLKQDGIAGRLTVEALGGKYKN